MRRHLLAAVVVATEAALLVAGHPGLSPLAAPAYALVVALVIALRYRSPTAAFVAAMVLTVATGGAYVLLLWAAYQAGHTIVSRARMAVIVGATFGGLAVQLVTQLGDPASIPRLVSTYVVFVALPLLAGRYLAQHERLVTALDQHNRQLRSRRELLFERERLRERLRIARDMHDSLGHRLSLASIQAAALEVSAPAPQQRQAVRQLARTVRGAMDELYELVGATRGRSPGIEAIAEVVEEFRAAGVPVTLRRRGEPRRLSTDAGSAAFRVVEEGLTNAAKHAPGQPVTVSVEWESDALLLTVVNPLPDRPAGPTGTNAGHGLSGLRERARPVGGFLDGGPSDGRFRLFAMLPAIDDTLVDDALVDELTDPDDLPEVGRVRTVALGLITAVVMFVLLPASFLLGVPSR